MIPVETTITLDDLLSLPYKLFTRDAIFVGIHKQFMLKTLMRDIQVFLARPVPVYRRLGSGFGLVCLVTMGKLLVSTRVYSYPLLIFKLCLLKLVTMELTCDNFAPDANVTFAIKIY